MNYSVAVAELSSARERTVHRELHLTQDFTNVGGKRRKLLVLRLIVAIDKRGPVEHLYGCLEAKYRLLRQQALV